LSRSLKISAKVLRQKLLEEKPQIISMKVPIYLKIGARSSSLALASPISNTLAKERKCTNLISLLAYLELRILRDFKN
jgi:hypothetical protein